MYFSIGESSFFFFLNHVHHRGRKHGGSLLRENRIDFHEFISLNFVIADKIGSRINFFKRLGVCDLHRTILRYVKA